ncbi:MAG: sigma-70 family RNA polymerase sigma factor [Krumholzibacteria bacterium]|nr:sigma-70 family RNA polymerase sigma factor [Candidatus Krumholzibacteria bacterium]
MSDGELDIEKRWMVLARLDPQAFDRFYDKYCDAIYRYCLRRTLDHATAEDLTAETFLQAQRSLIRFRWQGVTFGAYLYRIAQNLVRMQARRLVREARLSNTETALADPRLNPLAQVVLTEEQQSVRTAVAQLEASTQEILLLHYWEGLTVPQIAAVVGMNPTTVKTRLRRGRLRVRKLLLGEDGDPATDDPAGADAKRRRDSA